MDSYCVFSCLDKRFDFHVWSVHCKVVTGNSYELFWPVSSVVVRTAIKFVYLYCAALICLCIILLKKFGWSWWFHNIYTLSYLFVYIILKDHSGDDFHILKSCLSPDHAFFFALQFNMINAKCPYHLENPISPRTHHLHVSF